MKQQAKLSVITPVYNDPRLRYALDSVLSQRLDAELELVVIDGASQEETVEVIEAYRRHITILVSEPDNGIYDAMNKGIAHASGDIVGILNADDRYEDPFVLRDILQTFEDPSNDACYGDLVYVDANDQIVRYWRSGPSNSFKWRLGWMPAHPTFFVRREVYERYGVFDTQYRIAADYELMLRLFMKHRVPAVYVGRVLVRMANGGQSNRSVANILRSAREVHRAWRNNHLPFGQIAPVVKPAQKMLQFVRRPKSSPASTQMQGVHRAVPPLPSSGYRSEDCGQNDKIEHRS